MKKPEPDSFEATCPAITRRIKEFGRIEIGRAGFTDDFVKAIDRDGIPWGKGHSRSPRQLLEKEHEYAVTKSRCTQVQSGFRRFSSPRKSASSRRRR